MVNSFLDTILNNYRAAFNLRESLFLLLLVKESHGIVENWFFEARTILFVSLHHPLLVLVSLWQFVLT